MKYGLHVPHFGALATPEFMATTARSAETLGFESIWLSDHLFVPTEITSEYPYRSDGIIGLDPHQPFHDPFALIPWLAALTERVEIGIGAFVAPYRRAIVTAKLIGTADVLSGGRTRLVAGAGWMEQEFTALGVPYAQRGAITDATLDTMTKLFAEPVTSVGGVEFGAEPRPQRQPYPLMVGGHSNPAMRRALRLGHGIQFTSESPDEVPALLERLADHAGGAMPDRFIVSARIHLSRFEVGDDPDPILEQIRLAGSPGVTEVVVSILDKDPGRYAERLETLAGWLGLEATP
jgi:probable F420-dependent oxidoreductase